METVIIPGLILNT